jgi:Flp pilus assembly secretin CpaC
MVVIVRTLAYVDTRAAKYWWLLLGLALVLGGAHQAQAADPLERLKNQEIQQVLRLPVGHSKVLRPPFAISRISMADPEIAAPILIAGKGIYLNDPSPGVTNLSLWRQSRVNPATVTVAAGGDSAGVSGEVTGPVAQEIAASLVLPSGFGPQGVK